MFKGHNASGLTFVLSPGAARGLDTTVCADRSWTLTCGTQHLYVKCSGKKRGSVGGSRDPTTRVHGSPIPNQMRMFRLCATCTEHGFPTPNQFSLSYFVSHAGAPTHTPVLQFISLKFELGSLTQSAKLRTPACNFEPLRVRPHPGSRLNPSLPGPWIRCTDSRTQRWTRSLP